jgi:hypothetical protein
MRSEHPTILSVSRTSPNTNPNINPYTGQQGTHQPKLYQNDGGLSGYGSGFGLSGQPRGRRLGD